MESGPIRKSLGTTTTIFQAEVHAIKLNSAKIYILTDSQAALKSLNSHTIESRLVWDCLNSIKQLAVRNTVTLMWAPAHTVIEGNEAADRLARDGSSCLFIGPEPFCGVTNGYLRVTVKR